MWGLVVRELRGDFLSDVVSILQFYNILGMMLRHFGWIGLAMVAAWLPGWAGWLSGVGLEALRREVCPGVGGKSGTLKPTQTQRYSVTQYS